MEDCSSDEGITKNESPIPVSTVCYIRLWICNTYAFITCWKNTWSAINFYGYMGNEKLHDSTCHWTSSTHASRRRDLPHWAPKMMVAIAKNMICVNVKDFQLIEVFQEETVVKNLWTLLWLYVRWLWVNVFFSGRARPQVWDLSGPTQWLFISRIESENCHTSCFVFK